MSTSAKKICFLVLWTSVWPKGGAGVPSPKSTTASKDKKYRNQMMMRTTDDLGVQFKRNSKFFKKWSKRFFLVNYEITFELNQKRVLTCKVDLTSESFPSYCVARLVSKKAVTLRRWIGNIKRKLTIYCLN